MSRNLKGLKCIGLVRSANVDQVDAQRQIELVRTFASEHSMLYIDDFRVNDVDVKTEGQVQRAIRMLIERKRDRDDFDVLLICDMSRLGRGEPTATFFLEQQLQAAGIKLVNAANRQSNEFSWLMQAVRMDAAKEYAKALSWACVNDIGNKMLAGRLPHTSRVPFGLDRLYRTRDGEDWLIVRRAADGTRFEIDPKTHQVVRQFGPDVRVHLEHLGSITLTKGEPETVAVVRDIFRQHFIESQSSIRIAEQLNDRKVPTPAGRPWRPDTVTRILRHPVYLGRGVACRVSSGPNYMRSKSGPIEVPRRGNEGGHSLLARLTRRPESDWVWIDYPELVEYLGFDQVLRKRIAEWQVSRLSRACSRKPRHR